LPRAKFLVEIVLANGTGEKVKRTTPKVLMIAASINDCALPLVLSKRLIQVKEESFFAKFAESIIKRQVSTGSFVKQHAEPGAVTLSKRVENRSAMQIVTGLQVAKDNAAQKLIL